MRLRSAGSSASGSMPNRRSAQSPHERPRVQVKAAADRAGQTVTVLDHRPALAVGARTVAASESSAGREIQASGQNAIR